MADMESLKKAHGIQAVSPGPDHSYKLELEALEQLLLRDDVKDRAVVLVSVAGTFRKGKSFLLNFMLRYLQHTYNSDGSGDWLGGDDTPLVGFSWRGGSVRNTTGLLLWSEPFKATLSSGEEVVILLMDTQGTFDSDSTLRDNATIFALSTMLSSMEVYNLSQNIGEDDFQHLQLFTEYGRLAVNSSEAEGKPFQRLQFLVRDWNYPYDNPYGAEGGRQLLDRLLKVQETQAEELKNVRRHIASCFEELSCFLMPYPGEAVASSPKFKGHLGDININFKDALRKLMPILLARENLEPRRIHGEVVRAGHLVHYFKSYMKIFNSSELPEPKTMLEATAEANNLSAMADAEDTYETEMEKVCGDARPFLSPELLENHHSHAISKALHVFRSKRKMGGKELAATYEADLVKELDEEHEKLKVRNNNKQMFSISSTPVLLVALVLVGYLLSTIASIFGVPIIDAIARAILLGSLVLLAFWGYSRYSGTMPDLAVRLDIVSDILKQFASKALGFTSGSITDDA